MTKEIWAACIIGAVQVFVTVLVTKWQIESTKTLMNQETEKMQLSASWLSVLIGRFQRSNLHVIIPTIAYVIVIISIIARHGLDVFTIPIVAFIAIFATISFLFINTLNTIIGVLQHIMQRLLCHESILFVVGDKPCKDDGVCKFKA